MSRLKIIFLSIYLVSSIYAQEIQFTYEQSANKIISALEADSIGYNRFNDH